MLLILLFICMLVMFGLLYWKLHRDIFAPSLLFVIAYIVAIGCAVLNIRRWGIEFAPITFWVLLLGAVEFVAISAFIDLRCWAGARLVPRVREEQAVEPIRIEVWKQVLTYLGCAVYCVLLYREVTAIAATVGEHSSFSSVLHWFKTLTSETLQYSLPWWLEQMERIVMICSFVFTYVFVHNVVCCGAKPWFIRIGRNCPLMIPMGAYMVNAVLNSDRLIILQVLVDMIVMLFLLWTYRTGQDYVSAKTLLVLAGCACVGLLLFYWSAEKLGRITDKGMFEYITYYCGCAIENLNQFFKAPPEASQIIGKETFYNLNRKLYNLGLLELEEFYPIHLEFRYYGEVMLGNVYTAYRRWIYDFGFVGAAVLQAVMALVMSVLYNRVKYRRFKTNGFWLIVYCYLAYTIVFHPYDGYLYIQYVSQTGLTTLILFRLAYWFFVQMQVRFRGGFSLKLTENYKIENWKLIRTNRS